MTLEMAKEMSGDTGMKFGDQKIGKVARKKKKR
jgi:hypothetical protein